jgi:hypothetical protein
MIQNMTQQKELSNSSPQSVECPNLWDEQNNDGKANFSSHSHKDSNKKTINTNKNSQKVKSQSKKSNNQSEYSEKRHHYESNNDSRSAKNAPMQLKIL